MLSRIDHLRARLRVEDVDVLGEPTRIIRPARSVVQGKRSPRRSETVKRIYRCYVVRGEYQAKSSRISFSPRWFSVWTLRSVAAVLRSADLLRTFITRLPFFLPFVIDSGD